MTRSGEDAPNDGRPAGPHLPDGPAPSEEEQTVPEAHAPATDPDDDPFTGYEPV